MSYKRSGVTELPELNGKKNEHSDQAHQRRKALLPLIIEEMLSRKELSGAYGNWTVELTWTAGEISKVDITDHTSYK